MRNLGARRCQALGAVSLAVQCGGPAGTVIKVALPTLTGALRASGPYDRPLTIAGCVGDVTTAGA